jgi:alpha-glucosidase
MPGIPMLWAGDEIGQEGVNGEDGRRPFPWADTEDWNSERLALVQALFEARKQSAALRQGGLRWLSVGDDAFTFLREAPGETVLVHAARANHGPAKLPSETVGGNLRGLAGTADVHADKNGLFTLPSDGPAFAMWRCGSISQDIR